MPWFVKDLFSDGVIGPLTDEQFKQLATTGQVTPASDIAKSATGPWLPASRVKGLFEPTSSAQPASTASPTATPEAIDDLVSETQTRDPLFPTVQQGVSAIKEKARAYVESQALDQPIRAKDSLIFVVWKLIRGAKEYSFHDNDFPALSACLRIGASLARWWFCLVGLAILLFGITFVTSPDRDTLAIWCGMTGDNPETYVVRKMDGLTPTIEIKATIFTVIWAALLHCIKFLSIMGGLEFMRVILAIEKNTRSARTA